MPLKVAPAEAIADSMKQAMKKSASFFALLAVTLVFVGCGNQAKQDDIQPQTTASSAAEIAKAERIEVVDFHGTRRCRSCQTVEKYARETLEEFFQDEMENGTISFQSINGELAENQDLVIKYQAQGSSLFINAIQDGKDNIQEDTMVWRLVGDEQEFKSYFRGKIESLLSS